MKTRFFAVGIIVIFIIAAALINSLQAQCSGGNPPVTISYDTTGTGTGNDSYAFSLSKFDPSLGTLTSVTITSLVAVNYIYSIGNTKPISALYRTRILRTDDISSTALDPSAISEATQTPILNTTVPGNTTVQVGPSIMKYTVSNIVTDGRLVNFMGTGTVDFAYDNTSYVAFSGPSGSNVDFTQLYDTLHFSVTYTYCPASILASGLFSFTAFKKDNTTIQLGWQQLNEEKSRVYTVQYSSDGKQFTNIAVVPANTSGMYNYFYNYSPGFNKKLFFRVMQQDNAQASYSNIRFIDAGDKTLSAMHVFPTILSDDKIAIVFGKKDDRKITLYTITGQALWTNTYMNTNTVRITLPAGLKKGIHLVESVSINTHEREFSKIMIQ